MPSYAFHWRCMQSNIVVGWLGRLVPCIFRGWKSVHLPHSVLTEHKLHLHSVLTICILQYLTTVIPYDDCDGGPSNKVLLQLIESKSSY